LSGNAAGPIKYHDISAPVTRQVFLQTSATRLEASFIIFAFQPLKIPYHPNAAGSSERMHFTVNPHANLIENWKIFLR
jgi:hypothetical protein